MRAASVALWFNSHARWFEGADTSPWPHFDSADQLRSANLVNVRTPDQAVNHLKEHIAEVPSEFYTMMLSPLDLTP